MKVRFVVVMQKSIDSAAAADSVAAADSAAAATATAGVGAAAGVPAKAGGGYKLLGADEPPPFIELKGHGRSNFVILVDHASRRIPRAQA